MSIKTSTLFIFGIISAFITTTACASNNESTYTFSGSHRILIFPLTPEENCDSVVAPVMKINKNNLKCGKWGFSYTRQSGIPPFITRWKIARYPGDTDMSLNPYVFNNTTNPGIIQFSKTGTYYIELYYITVSQNQSFQCTKTILDSFTIDSTNMVQVSYKTTTPSCYGVKDGSVTFTVSGGRPPFLYQFANSIFDTIPHFEGIEGGNYELKVKDTSICSYNFPIAIQGPLKVGMSITKGVSCYNQPGSIKVAPTSGIPPFFLKLNEGIFDTVFNVTSLLPNTHKLFLKDSTGCIDSQVVVLQNAAKLINNPIKGQPKSSIKSLETYSIDGIYRSKYKWIATKGTIEGEDSLYRAIVRWDSAGIGGVNVTVTDQSGCQDSAYLQVYLNAVGLDELPLFQGLNVYPNPAKNILNIRLQKLPETTQIELFDMQGKRLLNQELKLTQQLNIEALTPGIYMLKIGAWSGQVVKE